MPVTSIINGKHLCANQGARYLHSISYFGSHVENNLHWIWHSRPPGSKEACAGICGQEPLCPTTASPKHLIKTDLEAHAEVDRETGAEELINAMDNKRALPMAAGIKKVMCPMELLLVPALPAYGFGSAGISYYSSMVKVCCCHGLPCQWTNC